MCVGLCVLWVAGRIFFNIFEAAPESQDTPLFILARRTHKELYLRKPTRPEESQSVRSETPEKRFSQSRVKLRSRELDIESSGRGTR